VRFELGTAANILPEVVVFYTTRADIAMKIHIRQADLADVPVLRTLIDASVRGLQTGDYTASQIDSGLATVYGVDTQLIQDGTYFVAQAESDDSTAALAHSIAGCGGWSKRRTLYGGDQWTGREAALLDPRQDAAKIRAFLRTPLLGATRHRQHDP
jgi:hypothetical protein